MITIYTGHMQPKISMQRYAQKKSPKTCMFKKEAPCYMLNEYHTQKTKILKSFLPVAIGATVIASEPNFQVLYKFKAYKIPSLIWITETCSFNKRVVDLLTEARWQIYKKPYLLQKKIITTLQSEGYEVYSPVFDDDELQIISYPQQILIKEDEIRYSSPDESFQILPFLPED